jgi:hypothetical protein
MAKTNLNSLARTFGMMFQRRAPEILTGIGISGMIITTVLAVRATPEAVRKIEEKKKEVKQDKLTLLQTVKAAGTCYIPAAVTGAVSVGCLVGATSVHEKRNAALAAAYQLSESASRIYREKVIETIGEKKEEKIRDEVAKEQLARANPTTIIIAGSGQVPCYDPVTNRAFYSDMETIRKAWNDFNYKLSFEMYLSVNDFCDLLGIHEHWSNGDDLGWKAEKPMDMYFTSDLRNGIPHLILGHYVPPEYRYKDSYTYAGLSS